MEDFFNQLIEDNVIYCEIRLAPLLHIEEGLSSREVVNILCNKMNTLSKETGMSMRESRTIIDIAIPKKI